jgi:Arc/MetJ family transcription regulator
VGRTNIDIDDALIARVMKRYRLATKKDAVEYALRALVDARMSRKEALAMEGTGWIGDVSELRDRDSPEDL